MNNQRTAKVTMNLGKAMLLGTAILVILTGSAMAQQSLRDLAKEYGCDWLAGRWTATTDDGTNILLVYKWELDGHLLTVDFKMGSYASRGMIFYPPGGEKAVEVSVSNRGGRSKGTWEVDADGRLFSKKEYVDAEGQVRKSGSLYSKVDSQTIKVALYGLNEYGDLNDDPWFTTDFKRKAEKKTELTTGEKRKGSN